MIVEFISTLGIELIAISKLNLSLSLKISIDCLNLKICLILTIILEVVIVVVIGLACLLILILVGIHSILTPIIQSSINTLVLVVATKILILLI